MVNVGLDIHYIVGVCSCLEKLQVQRTFLLEEKEEIMKIFEIEKDGLPDMNKLIGRVAFIFDGCIVSGWPLYGLQNYSKDQWEANDDVGKHGVFEGIEKYIVFDLPVWELVAT